MQSFEDVQTYARQRYRLQEDGAQHFVVVLDLSSTEDATPDSRRDGPRVPRVQAVWVQALKGQDQALVLFRAEVCSDRVLSPVAALAHSSRLVFGGLVLTGNRYSLRHCTRLLSMSSDDLDHFIAYVAREAVGLRSRLAPA